MIESLINRNEVREHMLFYIENPSFVWEGREYQTAKNSKGKPDVDAFIAGFVKDVEVPNVTRQDIIDSLNTYIDWWENECRCQRYKDRRYADIARYIRDNDRLLDKAVIINDGSFIECKILVKYDVVMPFYDAKGPTKTYGETIRAIDYVVDNYDAIPLQIDIGKTSKDIDSDESFDSLLRSIDAQSGICNYIEVC